MNQSPPKTDLLSALARALFEFGGLLHDFHLAFILFAFLLLALPTGISLVYFCWARERRLKAVLYLLFATSFLVAALIPVQRLVGALTSPIARTFVLVLGLLSLLFLPRLTAFVLARQFQNQRRLAIFIHCLLFILFVLNCCRTWQGGLQ